ncbi:DNA mismatch repair protein Mlh1-like [Hydractinia symbiolongicarpus]|uniref:DNA mismatch repair protein Mlh1-like n=1 Tax=Hydractinia symbiolongicarpus TaxID=13093 RepID=UPI00254AE4C4|nr:DNA mismatch repair protein Mlh1-like [Hydractinia symbiolongicarpus]
MSSAPQIQKLDEVVINRIAAGEIIQRPANAIKEMIENSLDAKTKSIQVTVKNGGLKLLQILDDGCGIRKDDLNIVCERFTTSKLSSFDDLKSISTYGFRGEALASISHVAHLTITTKTADSPCAYKAKYEDGKMVPLQRGGVAVAKPCAGNKGTQITVEDLFYNVAVRRKAFKNHNEEHLKIADVISKYSIHNPTVAFTLKKYGENIGEIRTQSDSTVVDNIKAIYGPTVARELLQVTHEDDKFGFKVNGYISNANYSMKKCVFLLFINHRLVESTALRKALDAVYLNYLPKDKHPFMYMSLEVNPSNVDVNVHPTKHEVKFLHEEMIIESIQECVETKLLGANESRQYYTQMLLPKMVTAGMECPVAGVIGDSNNEKSEAKKLYAHQMVRTDSRERKLQAFFSPASKTNSTELTTSSASLETECSPPKSNLESFLSNSELVEKHPSGLESVDCPVNSETVNENCPGNSKPGGVDISVNSEPMVVDLPSLNSEKMDSTIPVINSPGQEDNVAKISCNDDTTTKKTDNTTSKCSSSLKRKSTSKTRPDERKIKLTSVKNLRKSIDDKEHLGLKNLLEDHKFVGCVNKPLTLVQHLTRLYLVNSQKLSEELFYQILIFKFGNFGYINLSSPAPIYELSLLALDSPDSGWVPSDGDKTDLARYVVDLLSSKSEMLLDYFSLKINEQNELVSLPLLLDKYTPNLNGLPMFLLKLATEVNWDAEQECFDGFSRECSRFYAFGPDPIGDDKDSDDEEMEGNDITWKYTVEHVLFPAFRTSLIPPKKFFEDGTFLEVANLPDLYKVFERC